MQITQPPADAAPLESLFDLLIAGGPLMVPIALCSVVALGYIVERSIRLNRRRLSVSRFADQLVERIESSGPDSALELCDQVGTAQSRVLAAGLKRADWTVLEQEKAVEDAGSREVERLSANLRPLVVIGMITPLLGLLGTVWGMIESFSSIAYEDGLGSPESLASGISQALVTTAAGLAVAIPTQAAYYYFRARIDGFVRITEDTYLRVADLLHARSKAAA